MSFIDKLRGLFGWYGPRPPRVTAFDKEVDSAYSVSNPLEQYHDLLETRKAKRKDRYDVYDAMDRMPDVSTVLDAYAEDATQTDFHQEKSIWVEGQEYETVIELNNLLKRLNIEDCIEGITRDLGKYGDDFARIISSQEEGILGLEWTDPRDVERVENRDSVLLGFETSKTITEFQRKVQENGNALPTYKPWDFVHWRLFKQKRLPNEKFRNIYGTSLLFSADRISKQVKILDDLLMIVRLTRSLDRKIYYIDTGRSPVEEEVRILKRWRRALSRKTYMDPSSGRFDSRFNPFSWTEDVYWPAKEGTNSKVENLPGLGDVRNIVDIDHFRDKFFGTFRAPKAYFGYEGDVNSKTTLSSQSIRWGRAVNSLQKAVKQGITRLCQIHLAWKDMDADPSKFKVQMVVPSVLELLDRIEAKQSMVDMADRLSMLGETLGIDKKEWSRYILENTLCMSKEEVEHYVSTIQSTPPPALEGPAPESPQETPQGSPQAEQPPPAGPGQIAPNNQFSPPEQGNQPQGAENYFRGFKRGSTALLEEKLDFEKVADQWLEEANNKKIIK